MCNCGARRRAAAPTAPPTAPPRSVTRSVVPSRTVVPVRALAHRAPVVRRAVDNGIDTALWGPHLWRAIHLMAEAAAGETPVWKALRLALKEGLPCPECRRHYAAWLTSIPRRFPRGAVHPRDWFAALHNEVNRRNRKPVWGAEWMGAYRIPATELRAAVEESLTALAPHLREGLMVALRAVLDTVAPAQEIPRPE